MYEIEKTYTDFNGNERTEQFLFHLSKAELTEWEFGTSGGVSEKIKRAMTAQDVPTLLKTFKELVMMSYGVKSDDGRRFIKNQQVLDEFMQTEAFSDIFFELATDADKATKFINGITPKIEVPNSSIPAPELKAVK